MPFKKDDPLTKKWASMGGKKTYELDQKDVDSLKALVRRGIFLGKKMAKGNATIKEQMSYGNIEKMVLKGLDKFIANKNTVDVSGELDVNEKVELDKTTQDLLKEFITWRKAKT